MQDLEKSALEIAEAIFDRIEKDRSLIKQNVAETLLKELVFRFCGKKDPASPHIPQPLESGGIAQAKSYWVNTGTSDRTEPYPAVQTPAPMNGLYQMSAEEMERQNRIRDYVRAAEDQRRMVEMRRCGLGLALS